MAESPTYTYRVMREDRSRPEEKRWDDLGNFEAPNLDAALDMAAEAHPPETGGTARYGACALSKWREETYAAEQTVQVTRGSSLETAATDPGEAAS